MFVNLTFVWELVIIISYILVVYRPSVDRVETRELVIAITVTVIMTMTIAFLIRFGGRGNSGGRFMVGG